MIKYNPDMSVKELKEFITTLIQKFKEEKVCIKVPYKKQNWKEIKHYHYVEFEYSFKYNFNKDTIDIFKYNGYDSKFYTSYKLEEYGITWWFNGKYIPPKRNNKYVFSDFNNGVFSCGARINDALAISMRNIKDMLNGKEIRPFNLDEFLDFTNKEKNYKKFCKNYFKSKVNLHKELV